MMYSNKYQKARNRMELSQLGTEPCIKILGCLLFMYIFCAPKQNISFDNTRSLSTCDTPSTAGF